MALNGICCARRFDATVSGPNSISDAVATPRQWRSNQSLPMHMTGAGQAEAEHGEAHHQRAEMRPAPDREDAHDADLQRDHGAGLEADREIEPRRRLEIESRSAAARACRGHGTASGGRLQTN